MDPFFIWLESTGLSIWVRESISVFAFPSILALHTIGMGFVAGLNAAVDLRILGVAAFVPLLELRRFFPIMWAGFWLNAASGVLLLIGYPTKALTNPVFYGKLVFIALAVVALRRIRKSVFADADLDFKPVPKRGRRLAIASLVCWSGAILAGRLLAYTYSRLTAG
jgi:hypothetical protein